MKISLSEWDRHYDELRRSGMAEPWYGGPLRRHVDDGDVRLLELEFDNSAAALGLWNFLLTEEERLHRASAEGKRIVGTMKDLGTVPVMAYSMPDMVAFYPDGAWWTPCIMKQNEGLLRMADSLGVNESFCPVRAMLGAFVSGGFFPIPDMLICSTGAVCDDFSAISQRLDSLGFAIHWWEIPHRRAVQEGEAAVVLPGGCRAPANQVQFVQAELEQVRGWIESLGGQRLSDDLLAEGIAKANTVRHLLAELRSAVFTAPRGPLPALEMLVAEMLAIHFCSDIHETIAVLRGLLAEVRDRIAAGQGVLPPDQARVFWVNPVADLRAMNLLEECGGRICGTDYLFAHALDMIPADVHPMNALAQMALADPMVGSSTSRAERICRDISIFGAEAVVVSRVPGASHCGTEGRVIAETVGRVLGIPTVEIEVPPVSDALQPAIQNRLEALVETVISRRDR
jgi:benzoyl-CoA reductase/2-hydroxyglutaryl-CoA dehydratase subunit BcrC/BadD/HgdB